MKPQKQKNASDIERKMELFFRHETIPYTKPRLVEVERKLRRSGKKYEKK